ncbi:kin of IRRE-like protein 2 isoform X1 [Lates japonicus]|uniref:Kin of IRRE-like protein 2 isoform X1 n=1 Tax=Lates japonicus TaxID=270547 RepID=A0AAD3MZW4_LATJO|nr:kin of IRRE-like protein 2 isoform X1 [Lates japonicus]
MVQWLKAALHWGENLPGNVVDETKQSCTVKGVKRECSQESAWKLKSPSTRFTLVVGGPIVMQATHRTTSPAKPQAKPAAEITWYRDGEVMEAAIYSRPAYSDTISPASDCDPRSQVLFICSAWWSKGGFHLWGSGDSLEVTVDYSPVQARLLQCQLVGSTNVST